ncbi:MAG: type II toxin-antitoxin system HicB family antitoxin [Patescibacteria group bacterium]
MKQQFTAVYKKQGKWYLGWIEEIPGVNTQGESFKEVKENLKDALLLILETNRILNNKRRAGEKILREPITLFR